MVSQALCRITAGNNKNGNVSSPLEKTAGLPVNLLKSVFKIINIVYCIIFISIVWLLPEVPSCIESNLCTVIHSKSLPLCVHSRNRTTDRLLVMSFPTRDEQPPSSNEQPHLRQPAVCVALEVFFIIFA